MEPVVWVDAQLPPALARWLADAYAVNAQHAQDVELLSAHDPVIFAAARAGGAAIVITKDDDFVELIGRRGPPRRWSGSRVVTCGMPNCARSSSMRGRGWPSCWHRVSRWWS